MDFDGAHVKKRKIKKAEKSTRTYIRRYMRARARVRACIGSWLEGRSWNWRAPTREMRLSTSGELKEEGGRDPLCVAAAERFSRYRAVLTLRAAETLR